MNASIAGYLQAIAYCYCRLVTKRQAGRQACMHACRLAGWLGFHISWGWGCWPAVRVLQHGVAQRMVPQLSSTRTDSRMHTRCSQCTLTLQLFHPRDDALGCLRRHFNAGDLQVLGEPGLILAGQLHPLTPGAVLKILLQKGVAFTAEGDAGVCLDGMACGAAASPQGSVETRYVRHEQLTSGVRHSSSCMRRKAHQQ